MGADLVRLKIRFAEHEASGKWAERKYVIADFVAKCWHGKSYKDFTWIDTMDYFEMEEPEYYGPAVNSLIDGMKNHFPDIDYEYHCYVWYGDIDDSVFISIGGTTCGGQYQFRRVGEFLFDDESDDEDDDEYIFDDSPQRFETFEDIFALPEFQMPEATEENPYPIPKAILVSDTPRLPEMVWFVPKFKG